MSQILKWASGKKQTSKSKIVCGRQLYKYIPLGVLWKFPKMFGPGWDYKPRRKQVVSKMNLTLKTCPVFWLWSIPLRLHAVAKPANDDVHLERRIHALLKPRWDAGRKTDVSLRGHNWTSVSMTKHRLRRERWLRQHQTMPRNHAIMLNSIRGHLTSLISGH